MSEMTIRIQPALRHLLRGRREALHLTSPALEAITGIPRSTIIAYETTRQFITSTRLKSLASALGIREDQVTDFMKVIEKPPKDVPAKLEDAELAELVKIFEGADRQARAAIMRTARFWEPTPSVSAIETDIKDTRCYSMKSRAKA